MSFSKAVELVRLAMLASGNRGVCLSDIEEEFECVRRTAQRMTDALERAFPATERYVGDDGRHYWRLPARAIAPLLTPSAEELAAMSTAIDELERVGMNYEAAKMRLLGQKIRSLVPPTASARVAVDEEALLEALGYAARPGPRPVLNEEVDEAIAISLKGPFHLKISYKSRTDGAPVQRIVAPYGLLLGARRYLVAKDVAKSDGRYRHYRVEDITSAEQLPTSFEIPSDFSLAIYAERAFGSFHNDDEFTEVEWRFSSTAADRAKRFLFHPSQQVEELPDGSLIVRFKASGLLEMCWHLYAWGDQVEVTQPATLAKMVQEHRRSDFPALP
jgi:predicted DNA-binding transcriptional regulator YafY